MSTLSFAVHNDKENATPAGLSRKMNIKSIGPKTKGINIQPTPRKALIDVNHDSRSSVGISNNFSKDSFLNPVKTVKKVSAGVENLPQGSNVQKIDSKKTPKLHKKELKLIKETDNVTSTSMQSKAKKRQIVTPQPAATNDDDYDSDTIFPRSQRLSSYVDKLLTWRPPCLFGTIPDSEPESDQDDVLIDKLVNTPIIFPEVSVPEFSEKDLDILMMELPPLDVPEQDIDDQDRIILEATPNTSLSLGSLQMLSNYDLDTSDIQTKD